ncbi:MAG TPA: alpha/beta fold hydrolase [Pyrinomonadaceae bacterium]|nr:alpha/beta fold hydrolase [Pyrinomonadaceae bacterium]
MKALLLCCYVIGLAATGFGQTSGARDSAAFGDEEVVIRMNNYQLAGTLSLPRGARRRVPAVILITGSGQQTRDEAIPIPGLENYRPFRQIAEHLAARGIAVLRVDDRGMGGSTGRETLPAATTSSFADDVRAEVAYLRGRREIDPNRIALAGHSEGGSIAMMIAATDARIRAVVLLAAMGKTGREVNLAQQEEALTQATNMTEERKNELRAEQRRILQTVIEGGDTSQLPPQARAYLPWFKEFLTFDPLAVMRRVRQPVLILQGALDRQVTADQAALLERAAREAGNRDVTLRVLPGLNHLLLPARTGAWSEYPTLTTTALSTELLDALSMWLGARLGRS